MTVTVSAPRKARLAKALGKLETILQHIQGDNPPDFDYRFNLEYGRRYTEGDPLLARIRGILDEETEVRAEAVAHSPPARRSPDDIS